MSGVGGCSRVFTE